MTLADTAAPAKTGLTATAVFYLIALLIVALLAVNTLVFGAVGLAMTALAAVPVIFGLLLLITFGK